MFRINKYSSFGCQILNIRENSFSYVKSLFGTVNHPTMVSLSCLSAISQRLESLLQRRCYGSSSFSKLCTRQIMSPPSIISMFAALLTGYQDWKISNSEQRKLYVLKPLYIPFVFSCIVGRIYIMRRLAGSTNMIILYLTRNL